jgi:putative spermidine/putrescine transport system ATP-binding protein
MQQELGITFVHVTHTQLEAIVVADMAVVMTQGHIEPEEKTHEIYTRLRSVYVAGLIGGHSLLSGHVAAVANGMTTLVSRSGEQYAVPMPPLATDEDTLV